MAKTRTFKVVSGRYHFKCHACGAKRMMAVGPGVRMRSNRCHRCQEVTRCILNRRVVQRELQSGIVQLVTGDGRELDVSLYDISRDGVGIDVSVKDISKFSIGSSLSLRCSWNPYMFNQGRYIVRSIKGQRIGAELDK